VKAEDHVRCDENVWKDVTERIAKKGYNLLMIDLGEGIANVADAILSGRV
jgi:hypothetical protein